MAEMMIYQKMANILKETKAITKSETNLAQKFKFRGIDNVMNDLHEIFARNEVFILQEVLDFKTEDRPTKNGGVNICTRSTIKFRYMTTDGSYVETINVGEAMDTGDKGMNKAMSVALKYSLLQMFLIPTDEKKDPDYDTPSETDYLTLTLEKVRSAMSVEELTSIYSNEKSLQSDAVFVNALTNRRKEIQNAK